MASFTKTDHGMLLELNEDEVPVLRRAAMDVLEIITDRVASADSDDPLAQMVGISTHDKLPDNPILARLFPNAYDDDQASSEFRRYTETSLHEKKEQTITSLLSALPVEGAVSIELDRGAIDQWMRAINDLRLALGVVLDIDHNSDERFAKIDEADPIFFTLQVFYWLGWLQENLIEHA